MTDLEYALISPTVSASDITQAQQSVRMQTDGVGLRVGAKFEFTFVAPVKLGGAEIFRQRVVKAQIEAGYWEG